MHVGFRRVLDRLSKQITDEERDYEIKRERMQESIVDYFLRLTELTLVCGAVVYIEGKLASGHIVSSVVAGAVAIYARARATAGMLSLMAEHELNVRRQTLFYWLIVAFALLLWGGIVALTTTVVPMIANVQAH